MKTASESFNRQYQTALISFLQIQHLPDPHPAHGLGARALLAGLKTLDLARLHEDTLIERVLPAHPRREHARLIKRAGLFFTLAMTPSERRLEDADSIIGQLRRNIELLSQRTVQLASANRALNREIIHRKETERTLKKSERRYGELLEQSNRQHVQLRHLSRQILSAQEDERRNISRELHDVIAQTLSGINLRLSALKKTATDDAGALDRSIDRTQRLVVKAVDIVHTFARDLRPTVLDDLGLIPALHSFISPLAKRAGLRVALSICTEVEHLGMAQRTVLFRVAQEALTNVARHAQANAVKLSIRLEPGHFCMRIHDDGRSFDAQHILHAGGGKRLGLLGMRERLEMIGGALTIESAPDLGTTIVARIPRLKPDRGENLGPAPAEQAASVRAAAGRPGPSPDADAQARRRPPVKRPART